MNKEENKGYKNLIPFNQMPVERQREIQKKGARMAGEKSHQKKTMREALKLLLSTKPTTEMINNYFESFGLKPSTIQDCCLGGVAKKAMSGDISANTFIRDTIGEKPVDKVDNLNPTQTTILIKGKK